MTDAVCAATATKVAAALGVSVLGSGMLVALTSSGAVAQSCTGARGVSVLVDYGALGEPLRAGCALEGGEQRASVIVPQAGFPLRYAARSEGFVCRVTDLPRTDPCLDAAPANAHWSVWFSDGATAQWTYASRGVQSLRLPDGGAVALSWHTGAGEPSAPEFAAPVTSPGGATESSSAEPETLAQPAPRDGVADAAREADDDAANSWWLIGGLGVLAVGVVGAVLRRRMAR